MKKKNHKFDVSKYDSFADAVNARKNDMGLTWAEASALCGVNRIEAYALKISSGKPNLPTARRLEKICNGLSFDLDSSKKLVQSTGKIKNTSFCLSEDDYFKELGRLAEVILDANKQNGKGFRRLSSTSIRHVLGEQFYTKYAKSFQDRENIHQDILFLDKDKYGSIELQRQIQVKKSKNYPLRSFDDGFSEEEFIVDYILNADGDDNRILGRNYLPRGFTNDLLFVLNCNLLRRKSEVRTKSSLAYHLNKILKGSDYARSLEDKSPISNFLETSHLKNKIFSKIEGLNKEYLAFVASVYDEANEKVSGIVSEAISQNSLKKFVPMKDHYQAIVTSPEVSGLYLDSDRKILDYKNSISSKRVFLEDMLDRINNPVSEKLRGDISQDKFYKACPADIKEKIRDRTLTESEYAEVRYNIK